MNLEESINTDFGYLSRIQSNRIFIPVTPDHYPVSKDKNILYPNITERTFTFQFNAVDTTSVNVYIKNNGYTPEKESIINISQDGGLNLINTTNITDSSWVIIKNNQIFFDHLNWSLNKDNSYQNNTIIPNFKINNLMLNTNYKITFKSTRNELVDYDNNKNNNLLIAVEKPDGQNIILNYMETYPVFNSDYEIELNKPVPPKILNYDSSYTSININFASETEEDLTNFYYYTINGSALTSINPKENKLIINNLVQNTKYQIDLYSANNNIISNSSNLIISTPRDLTISATLPIPDPPTFGTVTRYNNSLSITFIPPTNLYGSTITGYSYNINDGLWISIGNPTIKQFLITNLNSGTTIKIGIRTDSNGGPSVGSYQSYATLTRIFRSLVPQTYPNGTPLKDKFGQLRYFAFDFVTGPLDTSLNAFFKTTICSGEDLLYTLNKIDSSTNIISSTNIKDLNGASLYGGMIDLNNNLNNISYIPNFTINNLSPNSTYRLYIESYINDNLINNTDDIEMSLETKSGTQIPLTYKDTFNTNSLPSINNPPLDAYPSSLNKTFTVTLKPLLTTEINIPMYYQYYTNLNLTPQLTTSTTFNLSNADKIFSIFVSATNLFGSSPFIPFVITSLPPLVSSLTASRTNQIITLNWQQSSFTNGPVSHYEIYNASTKTLFPDASLSIVPNLRRATINGVINTNTYLIQVRSVNYRGFNTPTTNLTVGPVDLPSPPTNLTKIDGNQQVKLNWRIPDYTGNLSITGYKVYDASTNILVNNNIIIDNVNRTALITKLVNGSSYSYYVKATNAIGDSIASNRVSGLVGTTPGSPINFNYTLSGSTLTLTWNPPIDNGGYSISGYKIYNGIDNSEIINNIIINGPSNIATIFNLIPEKTYYYYVRAINFKGIGQGSTQIAVNTYSKSNPPTNLIGTKINKNNSIQLSWTNPSNTGKAPILGYRIYVNNAVVIKNNGTDSTVTLPIEKNKTYSFYIRSINRAGLSDKSNTFILKT